MTPYEIESLYHEVAHTHPEVATAVAVVLDGQSIAKATTGQRRGVEAILTAVIEAWSASHGTYTEDAPRVLAELNRLHARAEAQRIFEAEQTSLAAEVDRAMRGGSLLDQTEGVPAVWGEGDEVLWASGQPFFLVAPPGVGKTTLVGQVVAAMTGARRDVLGSPVAEVGRVLYVAADRPDQITRSLRRHFCEDDRQRLDDRLVIWRGPPPADMGSDPEALTRMARRVEADAVILDSVKDMAVRLSEDAVGATFNRGLQLACVEGIEVGCLHHQRKGQNGTKPKTLEDVYGSTWLTAGAGSVVLLWGAAGDLVVELSHLKPAVEQVGPLTVVHDHGRGVSRVDRGWDALGWVRNVGEGSAKDAARAWFDKTPTRNEIERARRRLDALVDKGHAIAVGGVRGGSSGGAPTRYRSSESRESPGQSVRDRSDVNEADP